MGDRDLGGPGIGAGGGGATTAAAAAAASTSYAGDLSTAPRERDLSRDLLLERPERSAGLNDIVYTVPGKSIAQVDIYLSPSV